MRILVAEDDRATLARIAAFLREWGHEPLTAPNGMEAWKLFQKEEVSLVITDWLMPELNGLDLIKRIREHSDRAETPYVYLIILTSRSNPEDVVTGMEAGADDFIVKPFDKEELRVRLRAGERLVQLERALAEKNRGLIELNAKITAAHQRMKNELLAAARIQHSYLPTNLPRSPHADFSWIFEPCDEMGGDTLNIVPFDDKRFGLYVIDVAGHGVTAALLSVHLSRELTRLDEANAILRKAENKGALTPPVDVARELNERFQVDPGSHQFFSLLYGILDFDEMVFRFCSAGHPGPIMVADGDVTVCPATPPAIGFLPGAAFQEQTLPLARGHRLYLYTDGIFEVENAREQEWGEEGLAKAAVESSHLSLVKNLQAMYRKAKSWHQHAPLADDVSLLGVEVK